MSEQNNNETSTEIDALKQENAELKVCIEQLKCEILSAREYCNKIQHDLDKMKEIYDKHKKELKAAKQTICALNGKIEAYQFCVSRGRFA